MLRLLVSDAQVRFDNSPSPEFDNWRWVDYWEPLNDVVYFKRKVYQKAMTELWAVLALNGILTLETASKPLQHKYKKKKKSGLDKKDQPAE